MGATQAEKKKEIEKKDPTRADRIAEVTGEVQKMLMDLHAEFAKKYGEDNALKLAEVEFMCTCWK